MYLDTREGLGACDATKKFTTSGPGIDPRTDPMNRETGMCALVQDQMTGRFIDFHLYANRNLDPKDRLYRFQKFRDEDCYKDYLTRYCVPPATFQPTLPPWPPPWWIEDFLKMMKGLPPRPQTPNAQTITSPKMRTNLSGWGGFGQHVRLPPTMPPPPRAFDPIKAAKEAAEKIVPIRPETPDERLNRILREPVPTLPRGMTFKEWLDRKLAERSVPKWLRESIWKSVSDKNWGVLSNLLNVAGFSGGIKESIVETARVVASEVKVR